MSNATTPTTCEWCKLCARGERKIASVSNYLDLCSGHKKLMVVFDCMLRSNMQVMEEAGEEYREIFYARAFEIYHAQLLTADGGKLGGQLPSDDESRREFRIEKAGG